MKWILSCLIVVAGAPHLQAQGWRGLLPLRSTCQEVKQKLGIAECKNRTYDLLDTKVSIVFSDGLCSSGWDVPEGTVISLDVHSKAPQRFSDLGLDLSTYRRVTNDPQPAVIRYENLDRSVSITVSSEGLVSGYFYGPSTKDESLRCRPQTVPTWTGSIKFDEYGVVSRAEEETRLNRFAFQLKSTEKSFLGYILVYSGRSSSPNEAHDYGVRAKSYLLKQGVEETSVFIVEGGRREELTVELFVTLKDTIPPTPKPTIP